MSTPKQILVVDVESTCWEHEPPNTIESSKRRNEIIEIGITPIHLSNYSIGVSEAIIVLPTTSEISDFCTNLTTLTDEFVRKNGISFREAIAKLKLKYRTDVNLWASFGNYDREAFERQCKREMVEYPFSNLWLNVKALFAAKYGFSAGQGRVASEMGLKFEGTRHRGIDDSRSIAEIMVKLLEHPMLARDLTKVE